MDILTREEAINQKLSRYFTGKPCPKGHIAPRRVVNRNCVECDRSNSITRHYNNYQKESIRQSARQRAAKWAAENKERYYNNQKQWREKNKENIRNYNTSYRANNKERISNHKKEIHRQNPDKTKERHRKRYENPSYVIQCRNRVKEWAAKNPERARENRLRWFRNNPEKYREIRFAADCNRRSRLKKAGKVKASELKAIKSIKMCAACGSISSSIEIDHVIALSKGGAHHISNLQPLCKHCNRSKHTKDYKTWLLEIKKHCSYDQHRPQCNHHGSS